jgi:uncharacterized protein (TIGR03083 family)
VGNVLAGLRTAETSDRTQGRVDSAAFTDVVADESARLRAALRRADPGSRVPSAPDWDAADLSWHVAEVQWFWGEVVGRLLPDVEDLVDLDRPDDEDLAGLLRRSGDDLVAALGRRSPDDACWSWHEDGTHVGWVARRQAHEALIHRVDAELTAGVPVTGAEPALAADGIDELLVVLLGPPSWAAFAPDGHVVRVHATDTGTSWDVELGQLTGTSPRTGTAYDQEAVRVRDGDGEVSATVTGPAWDLDRWLWGRGPVDPLTVTGDRALVHRLRELAEVE